MNKVRLVFVNDTAATGVFVERNGEAIECVNPWLKRVSMVTADEVVGLINAALAAMEPRDDA